jgi:hypothetical protein
MEESVDERGKLLELISGKYKQELIALRSKQILELINTHLGKQDAGLLACALADAGDKTLFAIFKRAGENQQNFKGHLKGIHV